MPHIFLTVHSITVLGRLRSKDSESSEAGEKAKKTHEHAACSQIKILEAKNTHALTDFSLFNAIEKCHIS